MIRVDEFLSNNVEMNENAKLLLQVHDELVFEIKNEMVDLIIPQLALLMENVVTMEVEFPVKVSLGTRFGSLKEVDEKKVKQLKEQYVSNTLKSNIKSTTSFSDENQNESKSLVVIVNSDSDHEEDIENLLNISEMSDSDD